MKRLTGKLFSAMVTNGYKNLKNHYKTINDLNVFPVPDGDTGTNIAATLTGGVKMMEKADQENLGDVAAKLSAGMLLGARGNSGVITSQFFAGIADALQGLKTANVTQFAFALRTGTQKAYEAVVHPVEGTILTVAREGSAKVINELSSIKNFEDLFETLHREMKKSLDHTPELLPVLKEAGVIDSGGAGLVSIIEGMGKEILGEELDDSVFDGPTNSIAADGEVPFDEDSVLEYGYCTEFILQLLNCKDGVEKFDLQKAIEYFSSLGDSLVAIRQGSIVKIHVHTKTPGKAIEYAQQFGEFVTFKMENMSIQHNEVLLKEMPIEKQKYAIVTVAPSLAIAALLKDLGANEVIPGGQTMNPSAEDFMKSFDRANAENIIVFPNNSNVIMTAKQAAAMYEGANVVVIESKSSMQCYSALSMLDLENASLEENIEAIKEAIANVVTCEVSTAVRDSLNNGIEITEGDFIGISSGTVRSANKDIIACVKDLWASIENLDEKSVLTVFYGKGVTDEDKARFRQLVKDTFFMIDVQEYEGEQEIYPLIMALE